MVLFLVSLMAVEKLSVDKVELVSSVASQSNNIEDLETESIAAVQPNGKVEHIMLTKTQYEELQSGGTVKLGRNVRLRAKALPT